MIGNDISKVIQELAKEEGFTGKNGKAGKVKFAEHVKKETGLNYERVSKVWDGLGTAKICDYMTVLSVLGKKLKVSEDK